MGEMTKSLKKNIRRNFKKENNIRVKDNRLFYYLLFIILDSELGVSMILYVTVKNCHTERYRKFQNNNIIYIKIIESELCFFLFSFSFLFSF